MIAKRGIPTIAWILLGLLGVSAAMIALGERDAEAIPAVDNYGPSGTAALFEMLRRSGYEVVVNRATQPVLGPHDVAVCFVKQSYFGFVDERSGTFEKTLRDFWAHGGRSVTFEVPSSFGDASRTAVKAGNAVVHNPFADRALKVAPWTDADTSWPDLSSEDSDDPSAYQAIWKSGKDDIAVAKSEGTGSCVVTADGLAATNRFIDKADNAAFALAVINSLAKPGDRLVFTEASFGNAGDPGLFELIGAWALNGWRQTVLLMLVVVFTLGKRFGFPEEVRREQRSTRDLVDALAETMRRGRKADIALAEAEARLDHRVRTELRIPVDASENERNRLLPETVTDALSRLRHARANVDQTPAGALLAIQHAEKAVDSAVCP